MRFYFIGRNELLEMPFGENVRGLHREGNRPFRCYVAPMELEKAQVKMPLAAYLNTLQQTLIVGGRVEIKD